MKHTLKIITVCLLLANTANLCAQTKTFTRDYTYQASELDNKVSCRANATTEMRNILLREVGTYMRTEQILVTKGSTQEYVEKIEAITAGVVEMKVLDEKWTGETFWIKAEMVINPKEVEQKIKEIAEDKEKVKDLADARARTKAAEEEIARLRAELAELRKQNANENEVKEKEKDYNKQIETLTAEECLTKGTNAYYEGKYTQAIEYIKQSISINPDNAVSQNNLGVMYQNGYGVTQDYNEAVKWYRKSAEQGYAVGQYNLGAMYDNGYGVTQDYNEAVKWYRKSAEQGNGEAQYNLGNMYENGDGITQNYNEAVKWYRKSAEQGFSGAQFNLGTMYYNGDGVTQSESQSIEWYKKAAKRGNKGAQDFLKELGITSY